MFRTQRHFVKLIRLIFLLALFTLLLPACQKPPPPAATPAAAASTATPLPSPTLMVPTATASPALAVTPQATATATGVPTASPTPTAAPLPLTEVLTLALVAHEGGNVRSVAVAANIAYVGVGPRLAALDVRDPANPQPLGRSEALPGLVDAVVIAGAGEGRTAFVAAGQQVVALTFGADSSLTVADLLTLPGHVSALVLDGDLLYAGGGDSAGFVAAIDVQEPERVRLLGTVELSRRAQALALHDGVLYAGLDGLFAIEVSAGELGRPVRILGNREIFSLQVAGDTLLVGGYMRLDAYDIGSRTETGRPQASSLWGVESSPDLILGVVEGIAVSGDTIYTVGNMPAGNYIPTRLAFPAPEPLDGEPAPSSSPLAALDGGHLFVAEGDVLEIYDAGRPGELVQVGGYGASVPATGDLAIARTPSGEDILYLFDGSPLDTAWERLFSYRLPALEPLGQLTIEGAARERAHSVRARFALALDEPAQRAYLTTADGVYQIDIGNPAAPRIAAYEPYTADELTSLGLVVEGERVYFATEFAGSPVTALTAAAGTLARAGQLAGPAVDAVWALAGADNRLFLTTSEYGFPERDSLHIVAAGAEGLSLLTSLELPGRPGWGMLAASGNVVAAAVESQLLLIDVSTPEAPVVAPVALPGPPSPAYSLAFHDEQLFVIAHKWLLVIDVSDPAQPRVLSVAALPSAPSYAQAQLAVADDSVVAAIGEMGVFVFEIREAIR